MALTLWDKLETSAPLRIMLPPESLRSAAAIFAIIAQHLAMPKRVAAYVEPGTLRELVLAGAGAGILNKKRAAPMERARALREVSAFNGRCRWAGFN